jgi:glycine/D-amino acid oxidase-like deaminating enzyme
MTRPPGVSGSYWMESAGRTRYPALPGDTRADVAVVGGGIAGLCTAWELAGTGRSVVLLEAGRVAAGVSGHTTAKVTAQHALIYAHLRFVYGQEAARRYAAAQTDAMDHLVAVAGELGVDCSLERLAAFVYAIADEHHGAITAEAAAAREAGLPVSLVSETGLPFPVAAAVRMERQLQFHPRRFLLALAADLVGRGARVHENTRVTGLKEGTPNRLTTASGATVTAHEVVVATHYPVFDRAMLFARLEPRRELVVAGPLAAARVPDGMYLTPYENTRSVRSAPYGDGRRLLIVTGEKFRPGDPGVGERFERLAAWACRYFPVERITHRWATQDTWTADRVPYVGRFHLGTEHVFVATGFGGWGMTGGVAAGRLITALVEGREVEWRAMYDPRRLHPAAEAATVVKANLNTARHFIGDRLRPPHLDSAADIEPGAGAVVRLGGQRCAVHRDPDGRLHAPRLPGRVQRRRAQLGLPVPRLPLRRGRLGAARPGRAAVGAARSGGRLITASPTSGSTATADAAANGTPAATPARRAGPRPRSCRGPRWAHRLGCACRRCAWRAVARRARPRHWRSSPTACGCRPAPPRPTAHPAPAVPAWR